MKACDVPAYFEVSEKGVRYEGLLEHSLRTASVGLVLLERELGSLKEAFVLAAVLHDVGKGNNRSLAQFRRLKSGATTGKVSFRCHEVLSAGAVLELERDLGEELYEPVFYAVLRHHHAMRGVSDCLKEDLILEDVGKLKNLIPQLEGLKGLRPTDKILHEAINLGNKREAFVLTGFLSLADSVAAYLARRPDSSEKPSKFVALSLKERGWDLEKEEKKRELVDRVKTKEDEVIGIIKKYF